MVSNSQSKFIKSLKIKKYRARERCFIVEGRKNVFEGLRSGYSIRFLLATEEFLSTYDLPNSGKIGEVLTVTGKDLTDLGTFQTNEDCMAILEMKAEQDALTDASKTVVALDGINDPGNLGTIIRTMDWFGVDQLICSPNTTDFFSPKVVNATMGSYARVSVKYVELTEYLPNLAMPKIGATLSGKKTTELNAQTPVVLVLGSESHGISPEVSQILDQEVSIPGFGQAESLNVGIATGILLYQFTCL